jgi:hypothetical protein
MSESNRGWAKRIEAKIALALSRSAGNGGSIAALQASVTALQVSEAATQANVAALQVSSAAQQASIAAILARMANHSAIFNPALIGPANLIVFSSAPFTPVSGKVRVQVFASPAGTGGTLAAGDVVGLSVTRDGVSLAVSGLSSIVVGTGAAAQLSLAYAYDDVVVPGSTHTWGLELQANNGHTMSLGSDFGTILIEEQG